MARLHTGELTATESFALELLFLSLDERQCIESTRDMRRKLELIPRSLKQVHHLVSEQLEKYAKTKEFQKREFVRFRAGDKIIRFEKYPTSISRETIRKALVKSGWWLPKKEPTWIAKILNSRPCLHVVDRPV